MNESVQVIVQQQAGYGNYVLIVGLAVIVALLLGWIHYVNIKHQKPDQPKERSPIMTSAFLTGAVLFLALAAAALGILEKDWLEQHWYVFSLIFVCAYLILMWESSKRQPKRVGVLKAAAEDILIELGFESDDWKEDGFIPSVEHIKVKEDERLTGLRKSVAYFVVNRSWHSQKRRYLVGLNTYTAYPVEMKLMPEEHRISEAMADRPATPAGETDAEA